MKPLTVLIVDDSPWNRRLLRAQLEAESHAVLEAADGVEALAVLERVSVDAVITDVLMPRMDGNQLCLEIRRNERWRTTPIVICTSTYTSPADRQRAEAAGADAYLTKPTAVPVLLEALAEARRKAAGDWAPPAPRPDEAIVFKQYNAELVDKLEERSAELARLNETLRASEAHWRESEALYQSLVESLPQAIFRKDRAGRLTFANQHFCAVLGRPPAELLGRTDAELFPPALAAQYRADDLRVMETGQPFTAEEQNVGADGQSLWVEITKAPVRDAAGGVVGIQGVFTDITARRHAADLLAKRAEELERFHRLSVGRELRMIELKQEVNELARLAGQPPSYDAAPSTEPPQQPATERTAEGQVPEAEITERATLNMMEDAVRSRERTEQAMAALTLEVAERKKFEAQFLQAQKLEGIGQLAGGIAHDFNNILGVMMMQTELIALAENLPESVREGLLQIHAGAERAANLTRQLLLFSRKQVMEARDLDLNDSVSSLTKMLQRIIGEDVRLQLSLHPRPLLTRADAGMLDQVLMNLAVNARDAMPGGGRLRIETGEQTLDAAQARRQPDVAPGRYVCLRVSDTGTGISPEVLPRIFEPFFTTKEAGKGTGLGLATVFGIVKQHQGWLTVQSEPGQGATFQVGFPALTVTPTGDTRAVAPPKPRGGTETILMAEDDDGLRMTARLVLERSGYRVVEAASGAAALGLWPEHRDTVALLLTDLVMPNGVSGQQLAARLRADNAGLKVVFMSGYSAELAGRELQLESGQHFLQKPFPPQQLLETVRRALDG